MGQQQKLLHLNTEINEALDKLKAVVGKCLDKNKENNFVTNHDMTSLMKENDQVRDLICNLIQNRFSTDKNVHPATETELIRGREVEEFENLVSEVERLRSSLQGTIFKKLDFKGEFGRCLT